ncbi:MAG: carbohydrate binding domain-containing protein, partial [Chloroflexota bacterium]
EWYDGEIPEDYWLHDVDGNRVEVWPGSYRLNLTKPEVAELVAYSIYQEHLEYEMQFDGVFIDNVFLSQSWQNEDIFGNAFPIDANEDGIADDPDTFDEAWRAGVLYELEVLRELMPHAIFSGHAMDINDPEIAAIFNGISFGFSVPEIIEGQTEFNTFWQRYSAWMTEAQSPQINMIESAVPYQIGYGYGYLPHFDMPRETWDFARDYYPYMRFGLSLTLMQDGYFAHEIGDTYHGNDWWYDELNFDLGYPLEPAEFITPSGFSPEIVYQDDFTGDALEDWSFWVDTDNGYDAAVNSEDGIARIDIASTTGQDWRVELSRHGCELVAGQTYELTFRARASDPRSITLSSQKDSPDWRNFGLYSQVQLQTTWQTHQLRFTATETTSQARIQFLVGASEGTVWIDDVSLVTTAPDLLRRDFDNGIVLLNATIAPQVIDIPVGYRRLTGTQASMAEYIVDDTPDVFTTVGDWQSVVYDTDIWVATPPYYHDWGDGSHLGINGGAQWDLNIPFADTYTITAWLPATPDATNLNSNALYEIVSDGVVVASVTLDQQTANDTWQFLAEVPLKPDAFIRLNCDASAPCLADAFHVRSASRYHNGETISQVTLQPMDGIILERIP